MQIGDKAIVTFDNWFYTPDGKSYRAAWGTVRALKDDTTTLGIRTNAKSTNWYMEIGSMTIAGCQIHYVVECPEPPNFESTLDLDGKINPCCIFNADA